VTGHGLIRVADRSASHLHGILPWPPMAVSVSAKLLKHEMSLLKLRKDGAFLPLLHTSSWCDATLTFSPDTVDPSSLLGSTRNARNKRFREKLIAYFPLIRHGPHWKRLVQQFYRCVCVRCRGNNFTEALPSNDKDIHIQTHGLVRGIYEVRR
jgi:hypothetical protein